MKGVLLPWLATSDGVALVGDDGTARFFKLGVALDSVGEVVVPWDEIHGVRVVFPWTTPRRRRAEWLLDAVGPTFFLTAENSTYVELLDRFGETYREARIQIHDARTFDWRLAFATEVSLEVLAENDALPVLAHPQTWATIAGDIKHAVPMRAKFFRELFDGLDRILGGRDRVRRAAEELLLPQA